MNSYRKDKGKNSKKDARILTKETFGMVFVLFATLAMVCLITRDIIFSDIGLYINSFLFGTFGYIAFVLDLMLIVLGVKLVNDKKKEKKSKGRKYIRFFVFFTSLLIHAITVRNIDKTSFVTFVKGTYEVSGQGFASATVGGAIYSIIDYLLIGLIDFAGTYAVLGVMMALCLYFAVKYYMGVERPVKKDVRGGLVTPQSEIEKKIKGVKSYPIDGVVEEKEDRARLFYRDDDFEFKTKRERQDADRREESFKILYPNHSRAQSTPSGLGYGQTVGQGQTYSNMYGEDMKSKLEYIKRPAEIKLDKENSDWKRQPISTPIERKPNEEQGVPPMYTHEEPVDYKNMTDTEKRMTEYTRYTEIEEDVNVDKESEKEEKEIPVTYEVEEVEETNVTTATRRLFTEENQSPSIRRNFVEQTEDDEEESEVQLPNRRNLSFTETEKDEEENEVQLPTRRTISFEQPEEKEEPTTIRRRITPIAKEPEPQPIDTEEITEEPVIPINRPYNKPPIDLFKQYKQDINAPKENHEERSAIIERTLSEFGIDAKVVNFIQGPTVTRYEILMPAGVSVKKVPNHAEDIAMRLEATSVRIEAPIPGKNLVGIEVPNKVKTMVGLRDIIESEEYNNTKSDALTFAIGKDIVGKCICDNLAKGPHYLVAGATGMGKSVCLNTMIISLISKYSPEDLRLILVDPKQVEFTMYNHLPHLMIDEIITSVQKALATLKWAVDEMERRYSTFRESEVRDINEYNELIASDTVAKMPKIVIIVDEVSDLMQQNKKDLEGKILSLAQKARAAGIHLIIATQRPSVDVITGVIKTNLPSRIAFRVSNAIDSGTILSEGGAEKLLGNGDMLYKTSTMSNTARYQGAFISTAEVKAIVTYIKENNVAYFDNKAAEEIDNAMNPPKPIDEEITESNTDGGGEDELFVNALRLIITTGSASISMLQRRFSIGYNKAGGLIDKMDRMGYVSPFDGSKARQVLITKEEFEEKYGDL